MSVEKEQLFKVGDKVKILPTILADYPDFPCRILAGGVLGAIWNLYLMIICQIFGSILNKSEVLLEFN